VLIGILAEGQEKVNAEMKGPDPRRASWHVIAEREESAEGKEVLVGVAAAVEALDELLAADRCAQLVEAIVTKYVALSPEELQEWQVTAWRQLCCALDASEDFGVILAFR
jgi:hypothetical protein